MSEGRPNAGVVLDERPCLACGYSVRGLAVSGRCPECGAGVAGSVRTKLLLGASGARVRAVSGGLRWVQVGVVGGVVWLIACVAVALVLALLRGEDGGLGWLLGAGGAGFVALLIVAICNWWRATRGFAEEDGVLPWARASRVVLVLLLGSIAAFAFAAAWKGSELAFVAGFAAMAVLVGVEMVVVSVVQREIALRLADYHSWKRLRWSVGAGVGNVVTAVAGLLGSTMESRPGIVEFLSMGIILAWLGTAIVWVASSLEALGRATRTLDRIERYRSGVRPAAGADAAESPGGA